MVFHLDFLAFVQSTLRLPEELVYGLLILGGISGYSTG